MTPSPSRTSGSTDDPLRDFRGGGVVGLALLAVIVHALVIVGTSLPWLQSTLLGDAGELTEEQRIEEAVKEATTALTKIAERHGVRPQDVGGRFAAGGVVRPKPPTAPPGPAADQPPEAAESPAPAEPSAAEPPAPAVPAGPLLPKFDDDVDLFK